MSNKRCQDILINVLVWSYVIGVCIYHGLYIREIYNDPKQELSFLALNDLGDFLSGFFAPIAFVYLYKSYKQLQEQLQIANQTLEEQKKQAKESEEQLKGQINSLQEQVNIDKKRLELSLYPALYVKTKKDKDGSEKSYLYNAGEYVVIHNIKNETGKNIIEHNEAIVLAKGLSLPLDINTFYNENNQLIFLKYTIEFTTKINILYTLDIYAEYNRNGELIKAYIKDFPKRKQDE